MNTFQAVLATNGTSTYVIFNYGSIRWGSASTLIGFNAGDSTHSYTLPESLSSTGVLMIDDTSNVRRPGTYIFRVDQDSIIPLSGVLIARIMDTRMLLFILHLHVYIIMHDVDEHENCCHQCISAIW